MSDNGKTTEKKPLNKITIKQRVILLVSCPLIVIILCSIAIVITVHNIESGEIAEGTEEQADIILELPEEFNASPEKYCAGIIKDAAKADDVKISSWTGVSIHDMAGDFTEEVFKVIGYITGQLNDGAKGKYENLSVKYGESAAKLGDFAAISENLTEASGEGKNDDLSYTLSIPVDSGAIAEFTEKDKEVFEDCKNNCSDTVKLTDDKFELDSVTAYYHYSYSNQYITSFELVREYKLSANAEFLGALDVFGNGALSFGVRVNTKYDITHAGVSVQEELKLTKNGFQTLSMSANVGDDALSAEDAESEGVTDPDRIFTVEFTSSDETVATVDKTGMVEAQKISDEPVTVTVTLTYHGKVYKDTCTVYVTEEE